MKRLNALCLAGLLVAPGVAATRAIEGVRTGFFEIYEANRASGTPNYVTEDFLALTYAMLVENAATEFEHREALPALRELAPSLRAQIGSETEPERLAQGFLAVFEDRTATEQMRIAPTHGPQEQVRARTRKIPARKRICLNGVVAPVHDA